MVASPGSPDRTRPRPVKLRNACNQCCAAKVKCSGEKTGCVRCRNSGADCIFQESRVGKVPGVRAKRKQVHVEKQAMAPSKHGCSTDKTTDSISVSTGARLFEHDQDGEQDQEDTMSWAADWQLEPSNTATFDLLNELDTHTSTNVNATHTETSEGPPDSTGFVTATSSEESYMLSPPEADLDEILRFQLATPLPPDQLAEIATASGMPMSLGLRPRSEGDSQCCLECCQMINDLENYIMAELKAFKILLGIIRRALGKLGELITLQQNSRNLRCIMLFTTLMYQILELLEACRSIAVAENTRQQTRGFSGTSLGIGFGDFTMDAEEQSAFRTQTILKEVHQAMETLGKLRTLATGCAGAVDGSDSGGIGQRSDHYLDLELRFKEVRDRIQQRGWRDD
ncbi:hypothetical protein F5X98DRAFT_58818 [Xylaria grammica]|nr:hypothetical protein F5X98DRAFT_58818 [Xylaria grammica]